MKYVQQITDNFTAAASLFRKKNVYDLIQGESNRIITYNIHFYNPSIVLLLDNVALYNNIRIVH